MVTQQSMLGTRYRVAGWVLISELVISHWRLAKFPAPLRPRLGHIHDGAPPPRHYRRCRCRLLHAGPYGHCGGGNGFAIFFVFPRPPQIEELARSNLY